MRFTFGIREKTAILVIVMVAATAYLAPYLLIEDARVIVERHELVDLADEAKLRGWELFDEITLLQVTTEQLAGSERFRAQFIQEAKDAMAMGATVSRFASAAVGLEKYLRVTLIENGEVEDLFSRTDAEDPEVWDSIRKSFEKSGQMKVVISEIHRINIADAGAEPHWAPVICAGARVEGSDGFLIVMRNLERNIGHRHLKFLLNEEDEFLDHTNWRSQHDFSHRKVFENALLEFERMGIAATESGGMEVQRSSVYADRNNIDKHPIVPPSPYYIREGIAGSRLVEYLESNPDASITAFKAMAGKLPPGAVVGGLGRREPAKIRVLAKSMEDLDNLCRSDGVIERSLTEAFKSDFDEISWRKPVECDECDINLVRIELNTIHGSKSYKLLFSGFRDELVASLDHEMDHLWKKLILPCIIAGIIAFGLALLFVRPLQKITNTAQSVADTSNEALQEKVDAISKSLPVARTDEVGEIARALRRLFSEIQASTRQLDQRVKERTLELEKANEKLKDVNREKDTFLANVSHELRNPLNVVDGYLQFLEASELNEEQEGDVRKSRKAAKALLELINDILDYQKITMRGITLEPEEVDLKELIDDIRDSMEIHAERNRNKLVFEFNGDLGVIKNDEKRLRQVVLNLMGNACKFTQEGTVTLDTRRIADNGSDFIEFRVGDTGRGMTPEEQSKIFTVFYTNKKANESGTGLGLAISRELCRLMGGRISLESSVPGKGSTFLVRVPADISEEPPLSEQLEGIPDGSQTVLVIDDNDSVREMMRRFLTKQGYEVIEAVNGKEGIELARARQPDAITLDAVMPEIDGWDVLSTLKSDPATSSIPVVMVTILNKEAKGFALGADDYIVKPIDWDRFSHILGNLTDQNSERTILVVDDEEPTRDLFRRALAKENCRILEAENGAEALKMLEEIRPDIIVLDLMMPVMDGFEFLAEFNKNEKWQSIPVIVATAKTPTPEEREFLDGTVARVLQKGAGTTEELFATVHRRVDGRAKPGPAAASDPASSGKTD